MNKTIPLLLVLFLASCQFVPFERKETMRLPEVSIGTQGVEVFLDPRMQHEVYEGSPFSMLVTLSNLGTMDVEEGVYTISYEPQYLYLPRQQVQGRFVVRGKSVFNPQGSERQLNFIFTTKPLGPQVERYPATITFNACYPYATNAPIITCIDTDLTGKKTGKVCTPQPQSFAKGQGAPVVVATVEPRMLPHENPNLIRPEFILTLRNQGTGEVVAPQLSRDACSGRPLGPEGWNVVEVGAQLSDSVLTCTPTPVKIKLAGETKIVCSLPEGIDARLGTFTAPLLVTLDYGYLNSLTTQVTILKPS